MGLRVEDFQVGETLRTGTRRVTAEDVMQFADLVGDHTPIHVDEAYARGTAYGTRIAHGPLALSMAIGLFTQLGVLGDSVIGLLHLDWGFRLPVRVGDSLHAEVRVEAARLASKPGQGVLTFGFRVINQQDQDVQAGRMTVLMKSRGAAG
jgi:acyl dehydratase